MSVMCEFKRLVSITEDGRSVIGTHGRVPSPPGCDPLDSLTHYCRGAGLIFDTPPGYVRKSFSFRQDNGGGLVFDVTDEQITTSSVGDKP